MKTALIIPMREQSKYINRMLGAVNAQVVKADIVYFILDRASDIEVNSINKAISRTKNDTIKVIKIDNIPTYIGNSEGVDEVDYFLAGDRRNQAIELAISDGCDHFIFIDGDCIPQKDLVKEHIEICNNDFPVLSVGRRREQQYGNMDQRDKDSKVMNGELFKTHGTIIHDATLLTTSSITWSCNISLNIKAVKLIKYLNNLLYKRSEVFSSEFSGKWGGEDTFIGLQAYAMKVLITVIVGKHSGVTHIDHPRPPDKYDPSVYNEYLSERIEHIQKLSYKGGITMSMISKALS